MNESSGPPTGQTGKPTEATPSIADERSTASRFPIRRVQQNLSECWKALFCADILFKILAYFLLFPAVGVMFRLFLKLSGKSVLADVDIALFFLHPLGLITFVLVAAATVGIFAVEQAVLITLCLGYERNRQPSTLSALTFVLARGGQLLRLTGRMVVLVSIISLPFLLVGGVLYWLLLTTHDINFYLSGKPREFWLAVTLIGACLFVMLLCIAWKLTDWIFAIPILVFENGKPTESLVKSHQRVLGNRRAVWLGVSIWFVTNALIGFIVSALVYGIGELLVPLAATNLWSLGIAVGLMMTLIAVANFCTTFLAVATLASWVALYFSDTAEVDALALPSTNRRPLLGGYRLTPRHALSASLIAVLIASGLGLIALSSVTLNDDFEITAHRGGGHLAPENTMAAIQAAIEANADWVEIDVQETKDGVVVVVHDSDLKKVANHPVKIWEATADELRQVDIGSHFAPEFSNQRVPTLDEVLAACKAKVGVNIELKYYGHNQDLEQKVIEQVESHDMASEVVIMSLNSKMIEKVKRLRPGWTVGLLAAVSAGDLTRAKADFLAVNRKLATEQFVRLSHQRGKPVAAWTLNDPQFISVMASRGVDNMITDDPVMAREVKAQRAAMNPLQRLSIELAYRFGWNVPNTP